jgi:hypothetical protein
MSATPCKTCNELITFVLNENGRWRPVDVTYTVVDLDGDEFLALQENGHWQQISGRCLRVYKAHACIENPTWNQGSARTRRVTEDNDVDHDTGEIREPEPQGFRRGGYFPERGSREWAVRGYRPETLAVECPKCYAPVGEPCTNDRNYFIEQPHTNRNWVVAFGETEHWPPRANQKGYRAMRLFLYDNPDLFALPPEGDPS